MLNPTTALELTSRLGSSLGSVVSVFLQNSKRATLSTVARSNYEAVKSEGIRVEGDEVSGEVKFDEVYRALGPSTDATKEEKTTKTFSYIVIATKALAFVTPTLVESLEPYVTPGKSTFVLIQNGVGIEDDIQKRWPDNLILTCVVRFLKTSRSDVFSLLHAQRVFAGIHRSETVIPQSGGSRWWRALERRPLPCRRFSIIYPG